MRFPSVFVSHGAPTLAIQDNPASHFLRGFGEELGRPTAILVVSAHWDTASPQVTTAARLTTIYDFGGFERVLYTLRYEPTGAIDVAQRTQALLTAAGFTVTADSERGIDHGGWVPLLLMYPTADIPVLQLSVQSRLDAAHHLRLGQVLRPLREVGVLILGSGSATHNLREAFRADPDLPMLGWVDAFREWLFKTLSDQNIGELLDYQRLAPYARWNHPTTEHFVPLLVALGAGTPGVMPRRVHTSTTLGVLAMDAYVFD